MGLGISFICGILGLSTSWLLLNNVHHLLLDSFLFEHKSILVPDEIRSCVKPIPFHALFEQANEVSVIGILSKAQASAVMHEFFEFVRHILAQLINGRLLLLLFNLGVFFLLRSAGKTLPWKCTLQEIKENVANGFKIITS